MSGANAPTEDEVKSLWIKSSGGGFILMWKNMISFAVNCSYMRSIQNIWKSVALYIIILYVSIKTEWNESEMTLKAKQQEAWEHAANAN